MNKIEFRKEDPTYGFLSNFYMHPIKDPTGITWPSVEHYYQAMKSLDLVVRSNVWNAKTARDAKMIGKTIHLRDGWDILKEDIMMEALLMKFSPEIPQNQELFHMLLATGSAELIEFAPWDAYWGNGPDGLGQNRLGLMLMGIREWGQLEFNSLES